jgi:hypothetical protein
MIQKGGEIPPSPNSQTTIILTMEIITLLREIAPFRKIDDAVEIYAEGSTLYADFYSTNQQLLDSEIDTISVDVFINDQWISYCDCDTETLESDHHRHRYILAAE